MKAIHLIAAFAVTACGQAAPTTSTVKDTEAAPSLCETYAKAEDLAAVRTVYPRQTAVSNVELAMIQQAVLHVQGDAMSPQDALDVFNDTEHDGTLAGQIEYYDIGGKTLANVTYYPGDNEYGLLFQIWTWDNGHQSTSMIGSIGDGDRYCLTYVDSDAD